MSADEIRRLAEARILIKGCGVPKCKQALACKMCGNFQHKICKEKESVKSALLTYAGVVEQCKTIRKHFAMTKVESEMLDYILHGDKEK